MAQAPTSGAVFLSQRAARALAADEKRRDDDDRVNSRTAFSSAVTNPAGGSRIVPAAIIGVPTSSTAAESPPLRTVAELQHHATRALRHICIEHPATATATPPRRHQDPLAGVLSSFVMDAPKKPHPALSRVRSDDAICSRSKRPAFCYVLVFDTPTNK